MSIFCVSVRHRTHMCIYQTIKYTDVITVEARVYVCSVKDHLSSEILKTYTVQQSGVEDVWIQVQCKKLSSIIIDCIYRHYKAHSDSFDYIADLLRVRCRQCCRLSDFPCPLFPVPLVSHLQKRATAACFLKTTSSKTYIILLHLTLLHSSNQNLK